MTTRAIAMTATAVLVTAISLPLPRVGAQAPVPSSPTVGFEVSSVKPYEGDSPNAVLGFMPGGRFVATNTTLLSLLTVAFRGDQPITPAQIVGGPSWISSSRFDITAKVSSDPPPDPATLAREMPAYIRALLMDRFKLVTHVETRPLPVNVLIRAKADGTLGPKLRASPVDCQALARARANPSVRSAEEFAQCRSTNRPGSLSVAGGRLTILVANLVSIVGGLVLDQTGLAGTFDYDLQWTPERLAASAPTQGAVPASSLPDGPSIYTALQEQLGLKLESRREPVNVIVIDRIERPAPD